MGRDRTMRDGGCTDRVHPGELCQIRRTIRQRRCQMVNGSWLCRIIAIANCLRPPLTEIGQRQSFGTVSE